MGKLAAAIQQRAQLLMTTKPTGGVGTGSQSTSTAGEIETSRPRVARARSVSTLVGRYPHQEKKYELLGGQTGKEEEGTHLIIPRGRDHPQGLGSQTTMGEYTRGEPL